MSSVPRGDDDRQFFWVVARRFPVRDAVQYLVFVARRCEPGNRRLADVVAAGNAALCLASLDPLPRLPPLMRGEFRFAAEFLRPWPSRRLRRARCARRCAGVLIFGYSEYP